MIYRTQFKISAYMDDEEGLSYVPQKIYCADLNAGSVSTDGAN